MNMSSYEIERDNSICCDEYADWHTLPELQITSEPDHTQLLPAHLASIDPETFLNRMYAAQQG
jgi:hypothetical protein